MVKAEVFFYGSLFFLFGVALASLGLNQLIVIILSSLTAITFLFVKTIFLNKDFLIFAILSICIILGSTRYEISDSNYKKSNVVFDEKIKLRGIVSAYPEKGLNSTRLIINELQVTTKPYEEFHYGDLVEVEGKVQKPIGDLKNFYKKENIKGLMPFPQVKLISQNHGSRIKSKLFSLREGMVANLYKILPRKQAALLAGIILGEKSGFDKDFKEDMTKSGTSHLVALSGYNISIIAWSIEKTLGKILSQRKSFILALLTILGFVILTGAEASVVRASILATIFLIAKTSQKIFNVRNALIFAALIMVLINPRILVFDIGFELSFAAFIGILYLEPFFRKLFKVDSRGEGIFLWRNNLATTSAAQVAVFPLIIYYFGYFSPASLPANVLLLGFIPSTMALGFAAGFLGFISYYFSLILGLAVNVLLTYEIFVIEFFGKIIS